MTARKTRMAQAAESVQASMHAPSPPLMPVVQDLRRRLPRIGPVIGEAIKWHTPDFHMYECLVTLHLRDPGQAILHLGAKNAPLLASRSMTARQLPDWPGLAGARVGLADVDLLRARQAAFAAIVRPWIGQR
jgi:hypothetical protein